VKNEDTRTIAQFGRSARRALQGHGWALRSLNVVGALAGLIGAAVCYSLRIGPNWRNAWAIAVEYWHAATEAQHGEQ